MVAYKVGDRVEYHPVGGGDDNTSTATGEVVEVTGGQDDKRFGIKNDNTGKVTHYQEKNITSKVQ